MIVALGRHAGMLLLGGGQDRTLREMRGRSWSYRDPGGAHDPLYVTYHPSYVIRREERELPPGQRNPADNTVMADLQAGAAEVAKCVMFGAGRRTMSNVHDVYLLGGVLRRGFVTARHEQVDAAATLSSE